MLSPKSVQQIKGCRFCWMCRHLCPVQLRTGREANTPRAKALLLDMVENGEEFNKEIGKNMFQCLLCDACANDCATGYNPPEFIREGRTQAAVYDVLPETVKLVLDNILECGSIYGKKLTNYGNGKKEKILLYLGEIAREKASEMIVSYQAILEKADVEYMILDDEPVSGVMLDDLIGKTNETQTMIAKCAEILNQSGAEKIIVFDSYDMVAFKQLYPQYGCEINAELVLAVDYLDELWQKGLFQSGVKVEEAVSYHDDSRSARALKAFDKPRNLLRSVGCNIVELFLSKELAKCCGTSLVKAYMPDVVNSTAKGRWDDLERTRISNCMIISNPQAWEVLSACIPEGKKLVDLYSLLLYGVNNE